VGTVETSSGRSKVMKETTKAHEPRIVIKSAQRGSLPRPTRAVPAPSKSAKNGSPVETSGILIACAAANTDPRLEGSASATTEVVADHDTGLPAPGRRA